MGMFCDNTVPSPSRVPADKPEVLVTIPTLSLAEVLIIIGFIDTEPNH